MKLSIDPPKIQNLWEICQTNYNPGREKIIKQVKDWISTNPDKDHIYKIQLNKNMKGEYQDAGISGINQTNWLTNCFKSDTECMIAGSYALWVFSKMVTGYSVLWKPNNINIFMLGKEKNAKCAPGDLLEIIHTEHQTPEDLISSFSLPCCRVGFDMNYTFYFSIRALYSIFSKKISIPKEIIEKNSKQIKKYQRRGFSSEY